MTSRLKTLALLMATGSAAGRAELERIGMFLGIDLVSGWSRDQGELSPLSAP
jgi:hypothetical protein